MYFNLRSSEVLCTQRLGSSLYLIIIFLISVYLFSTSMNFSNHQFYVRGENHFAWGAFWMIGFIYWNFVHLYLFKKTKEKIFFLIPMYSLNISFFLAAFYSFSLGTIKNWTQQPPVLSFCTGIAKNFEIVFDAPSIWCVFAIIQGLFLFKLIPLMKNDLILDNLKIPKFKILLFSLLFVGLIFISLPIFSGLSYKMILK